jgi:hypothetical protein
MKGWLIGHPSPTWGGQQPPLGLGVAAQPLPWPMGYWLADHPWPMGWPRGQPKSDLGWLARPPLGRGCLARPPPRWGTTCVTTPWAGDGLRSHPWGFPPTGRLAPAHRPAPATAHHPNPTFAATLVCHLGFRLRGNPPIAPPRPPLRL